MGAMVLGDEEVAVGWAWQGEIKGSRWHWHRRSERAKGKEPAEKENGESVERKSHRVDWQGQRRDEQMALASEACSGEAFGGG